MLVLDEPTNHIDHEAREELTQALRRFTGVGILVSHDRDLLDALADRCISFEAGKLIGRPGGYTAAHAQAELERTAPKESDRRQKPWRASLPKRMPERTKPRGRRRASPNATSTRRTIPPRPRSTSPSTPARTVRGEGLRCR